MNCKPFPYLAASCFALSALGCQLYEVKEGDYCPHNIDGLYAPDALSDPITDGTRESAMDGDFCLATYPVCMGTHCAKCKEGTFLVKPQDNSNVTCLTCEELATCQSDSCKKAKERACDKPCRDDQLFDKNNNLVENCEYGCNDTNDACKQPALKPTCGVGQIPDEEGNCICDTDNNWVDLNGTCQCETDYPQHGSQCIPLNAPEPPVIDPDTPDPLSPKECGPREVLNENDCICNTDAHWTGEPGACVCDDNYLLIDNQCVLKKICDHPEILNTDTNQCICDKDNHWIEVDKKCTCMNGYKEINGVCEAPKICNQGEIYLEEINDCACDSAHNWIGQAPNCQCDPAKAVYINNKCEAFKTCGDRTVLDKTTNTCVCNTAAHWTGTDPTNCTCASNYILVNGTCQEKNVCKTGAKLTADNKCVCNTAAHWKGDPAACKCAFGFKQTDDGKCITYKAGEYFTFGKHYIENNEKKTAIEWKVLEHKTGTKDYYLLISRYGIDAKKFNSSSDTNNDTTSWTHSSLYEWLNGSFYKAAFSDTEKSHIRQGDTIVSLLSECDGGLCALHTNTVFMTTKSARKAKPTPYAASKMNDCKSGEYCYWWLKTTKTVNGLPLAKFVNLDGSIPSNGTYKNNYNMVRPIIWVIIEK